MARWTGDEWRWHPSRHPRPVVHGIDVIEPADARADPPANALRVPFGFGRELVQPARRLAADEVFGSAEIAGPDDP